MYLTKHCFFPHFGHESFDPRLYFWRENLYSAILLHFVIAVRAVCTYCSFAEILCQRKVQTATTANCKRYRLLQLLIFTSLYFLDNLIRSKANQRIHYRPFRQPYFFSGLNGIGSSESCGKAIKQFSFLRFNALSQHIFLNVGITVLKVFTQCNSRFGWVNIHKILVFFTASPTKDLQD